MNQQNNGQHYGENEWREIGTKVVAAVRLDVGHFLNASSFAEGIFKYIVGHVLCCAYTSHPIKLARACMRNPSDWLGDDACYPSLFIVSSRCVRKQGHFGVWQLVR